MTCLSGFQGDGILDDASLRELGIGNEEHRTVLCRAAASLTTPLQKMSTCPPSSVEEWLHLLRLPHRHLRPLPWCFEDTAALMAELDAVVTVDTAFSHLAGALGVPVLLMLPEAPDWRWWLQPETSPWYPSVRLVRQSTAGRWDDVIARVARALSS